MTFKIGKSGNPKGRPKGALSKRVQLARLLDPHAEQLVEKMIELALNGDVPTLRLCIERLIPKVKNEPIGIELPDKLDEKGITKLNDEILSAILDGRINLDDAERLKQFLKKENHVKEKLSLGGVTDPVEAMRAYEKIMMA